MIRFSPKSFMFLKTYNLKLLLYEGWYTDQSSKPLKTEDKTNIILVINKSVKYKNDTLFSSNYR